MSYQPSRPWNQDWALHTVTSPCKCRGQHPARQQLACQATCSPARTFKYWTVMLHLQGCPSASWEILLGWNIPVVSRAPGLHYIYIF